LQLWARGGLQQGFEALLAALPDQRPGDDLLRLAIARRLPERVAEEPRSQVAGGIAEGSSHELPGHACRRLPEEAEESGGIFTSGREPRRRAEDAHLRPRAPLASKEGEEGLRVARSAHVAYRVKDGLGAD